MLVVVLVLERWRRRKVLLSGRGCCGCGYCVWQREGRREKVGQKRLGCSSCCCLCLVMLVLVLVVVERGQRERLKERRCGGGGCVLKLRQHELLQLGWRKLR